MSVAGIGVDVVDVERFAQSLARTPQLRDRLFTDAERQGSTASLAGRFAAKEALFKALAWPRLETWRWHDAEVTRADSGAVGLRISGEARRHADELGVTSAHLSISHDGPVAVAFVVLTR